MEVKLDKTAQGDVVRCSLYIVLINKTQCVLSLVCNQYSILVALPESFTFPPATFGLQSFSTGIGPSGPQAAAGHCQRAAQYSAPTQISQAFPVQPSQHSQLPQLHSPFPVQIRPSCLSHSLSSHSQYSPDTHHS